jgi:hypothetical protein
MIRKETFLDGVCIYAEIIDRKNMFFAIEEKGEIIEQRDLTVEEYVDYGPAPLGPVGASAALNVVLGLWPLKDAANVAEVSEQALVDEVNGWAAAAEWGVDE